MIASINNAEYIYLGGGANGIDLEDVYVDQLRLVRNTMSTADINRTLNGSDSDGFQYVIEFGGTTIGSTDCSTSWWSAFSDYYRIPANGSIHLTFTNYTDGVNNWDNFLVVFTNDYGRDESEYSEYVVLRADAYGWGTKYNSDYMYSEYDWDTFTSEMAGANVDMTLSRTGSMVYMDCTLTMSEGTVRSYTYYFDCGTSEDVVRVFLTVEAGYLVLDTSSCTGSAPLTIETSTVGSTDCSTSWWSAFSDYFTVVPGGALHLEFTNYTDGVNNWDNFLVVFTNPYERTESEYSEYVVLRADAYGWGDKYNSDYMYSEYDWDTFTTEMNGAYVEMDVTRVGTMVYMNCDLTMSDKTERTYTYYFDCGTKEDNINVFLLTEAGYFVLETSKCTSGSPLY